MKKIDYSVLTGELISDFHDLMVAVQQSSNGTLPRSIVSFMEKALKTITKVQLVEKYKADSITSEQIAIVMYEAGYEVDYGSTEPVDDYVRRKLL